MPCMGSLKAADPTGFCVKVLRLSIERFAWDGPRDLDADMALDDWTEDTALDTLAEYLWATRNNRGVAKDLQPGVFHAEKT